MCFSRPTKPLTVKICIIYTSKQPSPCISLLLKDAHGDLTAQCQRIKLLFHRCGSGLRQWFAAAAAATHLNIYGSNLIIIIPYIVMYVAAAAAARCCRVYGKAP